MCYMLINYFTVVLVVIDRHFDLNVIAPSVLPEPTSPPALPGPISPPSTNELDAPRTRTFFPETWLFLVNQTKYAESPSSD